MASTRNVIETTRTSKRVTRNAIANAICNPSRSKLARKILARTRNALDARCIVSVGRYVRITSKGIVPESAL